MKDELKIDWEKQVAMETGIRMGDVITIPTRPNIVKSNFVAEIVAKESFKNRPYILIGGKVAVGSALKSLNNLKNNDVQIMDIDKPTTLMSNLVYNTHSGRRLLALRKQIRMYKFNNNLSDEQLKQEIRDKICNLPASARKIIKI